MGERNRETVKERERKREREREVSEKDEESMRIGKKRKSPCKTDVPKLYAYNECEHSVKVVLTTRNPDTWYNSVKNSIWLFHDNIRYNSIFCHLDMLHVKKRLHFKPTLLRQKTPTFGQDAKIPPRTFENCSSRSAAHFMLY